MGFKGFRDAQIEIFRVSGGMIYKVLFLIEFLVAWQKQQLVAQTKLLLLMLSKQQANRSCGGKSLHEFSEILL